MAHREKHVLDFEEGSLTVSVDPDESDNDEVEFDIASLSVSEWKQAVEFVTRVRDF